MAYSGLETLFQNIGPLTASATAGEREALAQKMSTLEQIAKQEEINKAQQEYSLAEQMNPLKVENQSLINQGHVAELPGKQANSGLKALELQEKTALSDSNVAAGKAKNRAELLAEGVKQTAAIQQMMLGAGAAIQSVPDAGKHAALRDYFVSSGADMNDPFVQHTLRSVQNVPANKLSQAVGATAEWAARHNSDYTKAMDQAAVQKDSHLAGIRMQTESNERIANAKLAAATAARGKAAKSIEQVLAEAKNPIQTAEALEKVYWAAMKEGADEQTLAQIEARAKAARQRAAEDAANKVLGAPGTTATFDASGKMSGIGPKPGTTANAPITGTNKQPSVDEMRRALKGQ